jgi:SNF2 family DNA or RNA helicase
VNKLRPYQIDGVKHLLSGQRRLLLDDPGLGKTAQAIVAAKKLRARTVLVVVPPATRWGWAEEFEKWAPGRWRVQVLEGYMCWLDPKATCIIVSYSLLNSQMIVDQLNKRWTLSIVDEIHFCKTVGTNRTSQVLGGKVNDRNVKGIISDSVYIWGLSGTLMTNTPIDLFKILRAMGKEHLGKYYKQRDFERRYCAAFKTPFGWNNKGAARLPELRSRIFKTGLGLRRKKTEVLKDLPRIEYRLVPIEGDKVCLNAFAKWDHELQQSDFSGSLPVPGSDLAKARLECSIAKLGPMYDYITYQLGNHEKILQFFWHKVGIEGMQLELLGDGIKSACYYGPMSARAKEESRNDFIDSDTRVMNANYVSAGTGLDGFQHSCSYGVFYDIPWCFTEIQQAAARLHRFGQTQKVLIDLVVIKGTAEQYVMKKVFQKEKYFEELLTT